MEVLNPSTWRYVKWQRFDRPDLHENNAYVAAGLPSWTGGPQTVFFRVSLLGEDLGPYVGSVLLDDLRIRCTVAGTIPVG